MSGDSALKDSVELRKYSTGRSKNNGFMRICPVMDDVWYVNCSHRVGVPKHSQNKLELQELIQDHIQSMFLKLFLLCSLKILCIIK